MSVESWSIQWIANDVGRDRGDERPAPSRPGRVFRARLSGFGEVPPVLTEATGTFEARVTGRGIEFVLQYANLSTPTLFAHIHFGQPGVNGNIIAFLCGGGDKGPCPDQSGTVTGVIEADDIMEIESQGVQAGDLEGALEIIRSGVAYANVHTEAFPGGEIRGQIR